jgi:hypothetical protein
MSTTFEEHKSSNFYCINAFMYVMSLFDKTALSSNEVIVDNNSTSTKFGRNQNESQSEKKNRRSSKRKSSSSSSSSSSKKSNLHHMDAAVNSRPNSPDNSQDNRNKSSDCKGHTSCYDAVQRATIKSLGLSICYPKAFLAAFTIQVDSYRFSILYLSHTIISYHIIVTSFSMSIL